MSDNTRFQRHERLMSRMADAGGVDLDLSILRGDLTPEQYSDAVFACTGCSDPQGCEQHLRDGRPGVPTFCRNGDMIARLSEASPAPD